MKLTKEQIKFMKENRVPFNLLTEVEQHLYSDNLKYNETVLVFDYDKGYFIESYYRDIDYEDVVRIRPEYEQEKEPINYDDSIKNINKRLGKLEAREGKMSKTDVKYIMENIAAVRKRVEELENKDKQGYARKQ